MSEQEVPRNRSGSMTFSSSATDPLATSQPSSEDSNIGASSSTHHPDGLNSSAHTTTTTEARKQSLSQSIDQTGPVNHSTEENPLNAHHRPSISDIPADSEVSGLAGDTTIRRASISQNAPGRAGDVGENVLGALGYGGARVERPVEDQGLGEKIVDFLGA